jgi:hypothetical protein
LLLAAAAAPTLLLLILGAPKNDLMSAMIAK